MNFVILISSLYLVQEIQSFITTKRSEPLVEINVSRRYHTYRDYKLVTPFKQIVLEKTCLLKPDEGPCRANIPMYYYKPENRTCKLFSWGGCQGNGNRFDFKSECERTCLSKPNPPKRRPKWCSLRFDYGYCFGAVPRWYYDSFWKVCKEVIYSGCGGNKNNFYKKTQCNAICRFAVGPYTNKTEVITNKTCNGNTDDKIIYEKGKQRGKRLPLKYS